MLLGVHATVFQIEIFTMEEKRSEVYSGYGREIEGGYSYSGSLGTGYQAYCSGSFDSEESLVDLDPMRRPAPVPDQAKRDWQVEFEQALALQSESSLDKLKRLIRIEKIQREFSQVAELIGIQIIDSIFGSRSLYFAPLEGKGIAGGTKFIVGNMFFKFVRDSHGIYGSEYGAGKAAKHELNALRILISACGGLSVAFPLMTLIEYLGQRLLCVSLIPDIGESTLVSGTSDGGRTFKCSNPYANSILHQVLTKSLNISPHNVISWDLDSFQLVWSPADLELHLVRKEDETLKLYFLDAARLFPPEAPLEHSSFSTFAAIFFPCDGGTSLSTLNCFNIHDDCLKKLKEEYADVEVCMIRSPSGIVVFQSSAQEPVNERLSEIAMEKIRGNGVLIENKGRVVFFRNPLVLIVVDFLSTA